MSLSMHDRDGMIWLDGKLVPWRESQVHVLTHALHYGSAVFEGEKDRALKAGFDDALMLDWKGDLAESTGANVFLVIDGRLVTPRPDNFLDGITRRAVIGMARRRGWTVEERVVKPHELAQASEVFLCGSAAEIVPVGSIDGHRYQPGPVARTLIDDYQALVRAEDAEGFGESAHLEKAVPLAA